MTSLPSMRTLLLASLGAWFAWRMRNIVPPTFPEYPTALSSTQGRGADAREMCHRVHGNETGMTMCEDGTIWKDYNVAILSCDPGRGDWNTVMGPLRKPDPRGALHVYSLNSSAGAGSSYPIELLSFPSSSDFHPLGIALGPHPTPVESSEHRLLHVVNHRRDRSTIELFTLSPPQASSDGRIRAKYWKTLVHDLIHTPNAVIPITGHSLFFSNDHFASRRWPTPLWLLHVVETFLGLPGGSIVFVKHSHGGDERPDLIEAKKLARFIPMANGMALLRAVGKTIIAVSSSMGFQVRFYVVHWPRTGDEWPELEHHSSTAVGISADNLHVVGGSTGIQLDPWQGLAMTDVDSVLVTGHPHPLKLVAFARNPSNAKLRSPTRVYKIAFGLPGKTEEVFIDDGRYFASGTSALATEGGRTLLLSLYENGIADCEGLDVKVK